MLVPKEQAQEQAEIARFASRPHAPVKSPLRVGVLMDGLDAPLWARKTIEEIVRAEHLALTVVIVKPVGRSAEPLPPALLRLWSWADRRLFKSGVDASALRREGYAVETVVASASRNGGSEYVFSEEDRAKIKAANLDVIIHLGSGAVPANILSWARYGVWTFSKSGAAEGDYAQFRDLYERNYVSTLAVRALSPGGERDLYRSTFSNDTLSLPKRMAGSWDFERPICRRSRGRVSIGSARKCRDDALSGRVVAQNIAAEIIQPHFFGAMVHRLPRQARGSRSICKSQNDNSSSGLGLCGPVSL
jgi:hypothetical protein